MYYTQDINGCFIADNGSNSLDKINDIDEVINISNFRPILEKAYISLKDLQNTYLSSQLPLLHIAEKRSDLAEIELAYDNIKSNAKEVIVLGTGGSSLGARTLSQLALTKIDNNIKVRFLDNLDPEFFEIVVMSIDLEQTRFIVISKSGNTPETIMQMLVIIDAFITAGMKTKINEAFLAITQPGSVEDNALRSICNRYNIKTIEHNPKIGGRFSVFTNVGLLPAMFFGVDPIAIREGAQSVINELISSRSIYDCKPALGAAVAYFLLKERNVSINVMMPYNERLKNFTMWFSQLWAESLGKNGNAVTPLGAIGPIDQHSMLQLFIDGAKDKFFTLLMPKLTSLGNRVRNSCSEDSLIDYLANKTVGDLVDCQQRATAETLYKNGHPVRRIYIDKINERSMGAILMHFILETIIMADLLKVDPFDQPAVEYGKVLAKKYLSQL